MLNAFSVENYRSFSRRARVELRPITLLLGRNSSGKSSLTRFIPLLQQSIDRRTSSPILWNSDVVDFGSIDSVLSHQPVGDNSVRMGFEIDASGYHTYVVSTSPYIHHSAERFRIDGSFRLIASLSAREGKTEYRSLQIEFDEYAATLNFSNNQVTSIDLNGVRLADGPPSQETFVDTSRLFPLLLFRRQIAQGSKQDGAQAFRFDNTFAYDGLKSAHEWFINRKTSSQRTAYNRNRLYLVNRKQLPSYLSTLDNTVNSKLGNTDRSAALGRAIFVQSLPSIISYCEQALRPTLERASYLGPSRASGARFYRYQELAVERIDSRGENLPMYLTSLDNLAMEGFNTLLTDAFGYALRIDRPSGHASIEVSPAGANRFENLADVGFGFSQLLPIVAQIHAGWAFPQHQSPRSQGAVAESIFAIEQPELHLHPAFQAGLGDLFVSAINTPSRGRRLKFLIETHSEALVARLGALISSGILSAESVALYFVEKDEELGSSTLSEAEFNSEGGVDGWPLGFFSGSM